MLKKNTLAYHERNVPTGTLDHLSFDYDTSIDLVSDVFHGLDHEFGTIFDGFVSEGLVDAFPRKGKAAGAFCAHTAITLPTYILLNHTNTLNDVLTIAHEAGHGINNEMIRKVQNATNFGTPTSTAEVARTFMEDFVLEHLAQGVSEQDRITLNMTKLNSDISSIHRQVACYRFEQALHTEYRETGHLTTDRIGELFQKNMAHYMGPAVEQSAGSETWWVYWSHIRNYFYVYSYASGLLISKALQAKVREDKSYLESVKTFLSAGTSASPKDIFLNIGIDLTDATFWKSGLHEIRTLLDETTDAWKNLNPDNQ
jgi:oligoendopeptidase F